MYEESVKLIEMKDHGSISLCVYIEHDQLMSLGEKINSVCDEAYMNGYNWDALITYYIRKVAPEIADQVDTDPEAGMFSAYCAYSEPNVATMKMYEQHVINLLSDEEKLIKFVEENSENIEWD